MARGRMISNSLSTSEKFAALSALTMGEFCQALYPLVVSHSDDFGRLQGDPFTVKAKCFPASPRSLEDFQAALEHLDRVGLIAWYVVAGKRFIQIRDFERHQLGLHKRTRSHFPRIPDASGNVEELPDQEKRTELKRRELNGSSDLFDRFWGAYPRKVGKDAAERAFVKRKPNEALLAAMLMSLKEHRQSSQWMRESGRFIPHPSTWLNQGRWKDEASRTPNLSDRTTKLAASSREFLSPDRRPE